MSSEVGVCLLCYACGVSVMNKKALSQESFDKDGHASAIAEDDLGTVTSDGLEHLCRECVHIVCTVTDK